MRLLIVGTLKGQLTTATKLAMAKGASVTHAESVEQALNVLRSGRGADLLMVDVALDIRDLVLRLDAERIAVPIVACGVSSDARAAVAAIHAGAKEYIPLPPDPELIAAVLAAVTNDARELIYRDETMAHVVKLAQQIAPSDASVLITGESGTGKEVVARYVHGRSNRARAPFISVNCAAIPENLLESELFGHEKGAFTGAVARKIGRFEQASGGTLFLDEVADMSLSLQAKILRAVQEREIERVGGTDTLPVTVRVIAATNRDLREAITQGKFREDLYYRLAVVVINLPRLAERGDDLLLLISHFVQQFGQRSGKRITAISDRALDLLRNRQWVGNVRELRNVMERAVILADDASLRTEHLPEDIRGEEANLPERAQGALATLAELEARHIARVLAHTGGQIGAAAEILGIHRNTLTRKMKEYGL